MRLRRPQLLSRSFVRLLLKRAVQSFLLILVLITINFLLIHLAPGDPAHFLAGQSGDEKYYEFIRARFGLDQPLGTQLWIYLSRVLRGDLGYSLGYQQPVISVIFERVPATLLLMLSAVSLSSGAGVVLGVEAARRENSFSDRAINGKTYFRQVSAYVIMRQPYISLTTSTFLKTPTTAKTFMKPK